VNIALDSSTNYTSWSDLMEQALQRYTLIKHVTDDAPSNDPGWIRMDNVVLNWISNSISTDLHQVVRERDCTAHHLWLTIENQFLSNREQRTLHLDAAFHTFVQGDLSINEYCRKLKAMADDLADLGAPVEDRILVLNIIRELNQRFEYVGSIIRRYSPFLNFLKVRDDLLLEEIHMDSTGPPRRPRHRLPRRLARPMAETTAPVATGTSTTTKTTLAVMAATTTTRTATTAEVVVTLLARPPPHWFRRQDQRTVADLRPPVAGAHDYVPRPRARWTAAFAGLRGHTGPLRVSRPPVRATTTVVVPAGRPGPRMEPLARRKLGLAVAGQLL
jgi:hypothetical protein